MCSNRWVLGLVTEKAEGSLCSKLCVRSYPFDPSQKASLDCAVAGIGAVVALQRRRWYLPGTRTHKLLLDVHVLVGGWAFGTAGLRDRGCYECL